jgi:TRAP-type C4-dicarboxylate transport system permease small subunit
MNTRLAGLAYRIAVILRLAYWIAIILFCVMMAYSGLLYLTSSGFREKFAHLGFPPFFSGRNRNLQIGGSYRPSIPCPRGSGNGRTQGSSSTC